MSPDISDMLGKAQELQRRMQELQRDLANRRFEAAAGGGMVTAVASGDLRILEVAIEPSLLAPAEGETAVDRDMLQDLCAAACNAALRAAQQGAQDEMQKLSGSLGLPGLGGLFGGS